MKVEIKPTGKRPVKTEGYASAKLAARRELRGTQALQRQARYDALSHAEKITRVEARGGSNRELARLGRPPQ